MAKYEPFSSKRKVEKLWNKSVEEEQTIDNLPNKTIVFRQEHFQKRMTIIPILKNEPINWSGESILVGFPEQFIPMIKPVGYFSVPGDGFNMDLIDFSGGAEISFTYWFNKRSSDVYSFQFNIETDASLVQNETDVPLLANVSLYIINNLNYDNIIKAKQ